MESISRLGNPIRNLFSIDPYDQLYHQLDAELGFDIYQKLSKSIVIKLKWQIYGQLERDIENEAD